MALERLEMRVNGGRRREAYALADLPHGRRVAPLGCKLADYLEDAPLALRGLFHRSSQQKCHPYGMR